MTKFNLFFTALLLALASLPASAMFTRMRSVFKPLAAATVRRLTAPKIAGLAVGAAALYGTNNVRRAHALEGQKGGELPDAKKYPALHKFFKKHECSAEVREALEKERDNIERDNIESLMYKHNKVYRYRNIHFYKKPIRDFERVHNAWRMQKVFERYNLTTLAVADKCLCSVGGEWHVTAAAIQRGVEKKYSKKEIEEIIIAADQTRYIDWKSGIDHIHANVFRDKSGKLTFIDTDEMAFLPEKRAGVIWDPEWAFVCYINRLERAEDATEEWLARELENKRRNNKPSGWHQKKYDDPGIDFEQVKKEFKLWQKEMAEQKALEREGG